MSLSAATTPATTSSPSKVKKPAKVKNIAMWSLQCLVAALFLFAAEPKLSSAPSAVAGFAPFAKYGIGQWFRFLTGAVETLGAILLLVPRFVFIGALMLAAVMVGAIATTLLFGLNPALPIVVLILTATIAWFRRPYHPRTF